MNGSALPVSGKQQPSYMGRLLDVLDATVTATEPPTVTEIAVAAGTPLSTTSRLVSLLTEKGFLIQSTGRYAAGPRLTHVALRVLDQIHDTDRLVAATRELSANSGESVSAGLVVGDSIVLVARTESPQSLRAVARVGDIINPHTSALGKAVLSWLPCDRRLQLLVRTTTGDDAEGVLAELTDELVTAHEKGYALDEETYAVGLRCRAAAIRGHDGQAIGGISIAGPSARFTPDAAAAAVPALLESVDRLSVHPRSS